MRESTLLKGGASLPFLAPFPKFSGTLSSLHPNFLKQSRQPSHTPHPPYISFFSLHHRGFLSVQSGVSSRSSSARSSCPSGLCYLGGNGILIAARFRPFFSLGTTITRLCSLQKRQSHSPVSVVSIGSIAVGVLVPLGFQFFQNCLAIAIKHQPLR